MAKKSILRKKGQITIPTVIRKEIGLKEEDALTFQVWDKKAIIIIPQDLKTPDLLEKTAKMAKEKGVSLEEMLLELEEVRRNA